MKHGPLGISTAVRIQGPEPIMCGNVRGAVLDGRDIGTVVFPDADRKFFIYADINIRADRRTKELRQSGQSVMFRDVLLDLKSRDDRDRTRIASPMKAAEDAVAIDTSKLDESAVLALALTFI